MAETSADAVPVSYEDLAMIEAEFEEVDTEISKSALKSVKPLQENFTMLTVASSL